MSVAYRDLLRRVGRLREDAEPMNGASELELQAGFYRGDFGLSWTGTEGEQIEMIHPGRWNREPGPDFREARLIIGGREVRGDIEIDLTARDWEAHGHASNEAFNNVVLHGFFRAGTRRFYTRNAENRVVPQVMLPTAAAPGRPASVRLAYEPLEEARASELITAACRYRLHRKRRAFQNAARLVGEDEAFFQMLATGLGYKNNKIPFLLVAQRVGLARARRAEGEALLFGLAGFLQADYFDQGDEADKRYLRPLWEEWWARRDQEARLILPPESWKFAPIRPANHPHRRLGALAALARDFSRLYATLATKEIGRFIELLTAVDHPYWRDRWNLSKDALPKRMALLGADRARDLAINAFIPALPTEEDSLRLLSSLGAPAPSRKVEQSAEWLRGEAWSARSLASALTQQGLVQLYDDFFPQNPTEVWEGYERHSTERAEL